MKNRQSVRAPKGLIALFLLVTVSSVSLSTLSRMVPLGLAGNFGDSLDWFDLGANIARFGVLGDGEWRAIHRPPGYPAFVAVALTVFSGTSEASIRGGTRGPVAVLTAQALTLGLCAMVCFLWLARRIRLESAFAAALVLGLNPYSLVMATFIHYDVLYWLSLMIFLLVHEIAADAQSRQARAWMFTAGIALGLCTLIRPLTLIAPVTFSAAFLVQRGSARRIGSYATFFSGFFLCLLPWTVRNYSVSGRLIPVNSQAWTALMASTSEPLENDPDRYQWGEVAPKRFMPIYRRVTGQQDYDLDVYIRNIVALEDAARVAVMTNLRDQPTVYLRNVVHSGYSLVTQVNALALTIFTRLQERTGFGATWIFGSKELGLSRGAEARSFQFLHDTLLGLSLLGLILAVIRGDRSQAFPAVLGGTIILTHALSHLDFFYYAIKIPFLASFAFFTIDALPRPVRLSLTVGVVAWALGLSWSMRFFGPF